MSFVLISIALLATLIATIYLYVKNAFSYWKRKGVPYVEPTFLFGNFKNVFLQKLSFAGELQRLYNITSGPFYGIYSSFAPALLLRDPRVIRDILVKDFSSFDEHGWFIDEKIDHMYNNILMQNGEKWKRMRTMLTPAFTSGKVKGMFPTIVDCGKSLDKYMSKHAENCEIVEVREVFALYATNIIASIAFGFDINCLEPKSAADSEFREHGKRFFESTFKNAMRKAMIFSAPKLAKLFRVRFVDKDVTDYMTGIVEQNIEYREKNNFSRKDFFQLLLQVRNTGAVNEDHDWATKVSEGVKSLSSDEITAQAHIFLVGGYESSSATMSFCLYEMARNTQAQDKAFKEIVSVLDKFNGDLNYECVSEMKYLDHCIDETLRLHPPFGFTSRKCTKDYNIPDSDVIVEKGTIVFISIEGLHRDPKYFENPDDFIPERFEGEQSAHKTFAEKPLLAFGDGPRGCIGIRLAKIQSKLGIISLLRKFKFELSEEHKNKKLEIDPKSIAKAALQGINLKVSFR